MQISIRHNPATKPDADSPEGSVATPDQACVWITDESGVSIKTIYLEDNQQVTIDVTIPAPKVTQGQPEVTVGEVQPEAGTPALGEEPEKLS